MTSSTELLEATKTEVDARWGRGASLWGEDGSCILGCLGFARFSDTFEVDGSWVLQTEAYDRLRSDPLTAEAISLLARHVNPDEVDADPADDVELVYRHNDTQFDTAQEVKDFIDGVLRDMTATLGNKAL